jgi:DUF2933 family protein
MSSHDHLDEKPSARGGFFSSMRFSVVLLGFFVIVGILLFTEHRAHVLGALIYLPLLICPLMHFFMHGGHGSHGGGHRHEDRERRAS